MYLKYFIYINIISKKVYMQNPMYYLKKQKYLFIFIIYLKNLVLPHFSNEIKKLIN